MTTRKTAGSPFREDFATECARTITAAAGHAHDVDVMYRDMIEIMYITIRNANEPRDADWSEREARYMAHVAKYGRAAFETFTRIMAEAVIEAGLRKGDLFGEIYMGMSQGRRGMAQHFTPYAVSSFMASIAIAGADDAVRDNGFLSMMEPACGSGGMVVAAAAAFEARGHDVFRELRVTAQDLDPVCMRMTYLACWLYGIPAKVILGDTLRMEEREVALTPALLRAAAAGLPF